MFEKISRMILAELSKVSLQQEDVVGIDITQDYIRVTQLDNVNDEWVLTKLGYKFIEQSGVSIQTNPKIYINKLKEVVDQQKINKSNVAVSIPVSSAIIKVVTMPLMSDEELEEAIRTDSLWENVIQLNHALDEYSIFWQVIKRDTKQSYMDLLFVGSKLLDVQCYLDVIEQAGLNPVVVDVRCFAVSNALKIYGGLVTKNTPKVVIEIGAHENYVMIIRNDAPFISDIYVAEKDRKILAKLLTDKSGAKVVIERMAMQIKQVINIYEVKYKVISIESLLVTTDLDGYEQAIKLLGESLPEFKIELFEVTSKLVVPANFKEKLYAEPNQSALVPSLGLATRKLDVFGFYQYVTGTSNINLMPNRNSIKSEEKNKFMGKWGLVLFSIVFVLVSGAFFIDNHSETEKLDDHLVEYNSSIAQLDNLKMELAEINEELSKTNNTLAVSKDVHSNQVFLYAVLQSTIKSIPRGVSLKAIIYEKGRLQIDGISVSDQNILGLIERLERSPVILQVSLENMSIEKVGKNEFKAFSVRVTLDTTRKSVAIKKEDI